MNNDIILFLLGDMIKKFGYTVLKTKSEYTIVQINKEMFTYPIIGVNKYSERKRMSVIIKRDKRDNESILLCKGTDINIFNYIENPDENDIKFVKEQIKRLTAIGYRYLIFCKKILSEEDTLTYI